MPCGASTYESLDVSEWMLFEETATGLLYAPGSPRSRRRPEMIKAIPRPCIQNKEIKIAYHDDLDHYPAKVYAKGRHQYLGALTSPGHRDTEQSAT